MGIGAHLIEYARPLFDQTDGSKAELDKVLSLASMCWTLSMLDEAGRNGALEKMAATVRMAPEEFELFRHDIVEPMLRRHRELYPGMHRSTQRIATPDAPDVCRYEGFAGARPEPMGRSVRTGRNEPCPCGSGKKHKKCCGRE